MFFQLIFALIFCAAWPATAGEWDAVTTALQNNSSQSVTGLSKQERRLLQASLALKGAEPGKALRLLAQAKGGSDPLVALLQAEARRQQAVTAVREAGGSGKALQLLASADLKQGLGETDARLHALMGKLEPDKGVPLDALLLGPDVASLFLFDKARSRMFVYQPGGDGRLKKITDEYVVTGSIKGDKTHSGDGRTPTGVYHFTKKLQGKALQAIYGPMAFPIDYPNELDRLHQKDGSGIWLHGYPIDVSRRPPQDTRGCFSLSNDRLSAMDSHIRLGKTWVVVGNNLRFGRRHENSKLLASVKQDLEAWRRDWTNLKSDPYLAHYHRSFHSGKYNLAAWKKYKKRVNGSKSFIDVRLSDLTLIRDPNRWPEGEVVVAEFMQHYRSTNYADVSRKRLYLARQNSGEDWKILIEGSL
ncbi:MAG: L,D-transpeptidase family protein [Mariprofundus sp.]|nr:L,D-transpeptidase family protein [Mariprofundus sp.]